MLPPVPVTSRVHALGLLAILAATLVVVPGITPSFSSDDYVHLERNLAFASPSEALAVFTRPDGREYRPLVRVSLWLNARMGNGAIAFGLTNLLLHLACTLMVFVFLTRLGASAGGALLGTAVFALHPVHTLNLHFIMGRTDLVCALFYLGALLAMLGYLRTGRKTALAGTLCLGALALMSKEMAVSLPLTAGAIGWYFAANGALRRRAWRGTAALAALVLIYLVMRLLTWTENLESVGGYTDFSPANIVSNIARGLTGLLWPGDLYLLRDWLETGSPALAALVVLGIILAMPMVFLVRKGGFDRRMLVLGLLFIALSLMPVLGSLIHRWYLYIPSIGLAVTLAAVWPRIPGPSGRRARTLIAGLAVLVASGMAAEQLRQSMVWRERAALDEEVLAALDQAGIPELEHVALANLPWGYRSSFLFTWQSVESAMRLRFGSSPRVDILSWTNLSDQPKIRVHPGTDSIAFTTRPDREHFWLFTGARRLLQASEILSLDHFEIHIEEVDAGGRPSRYSIHPTSKQPPDLYYFQYTDLAPAGITGTQSRPGPPAPNPRARPAGRLARSGRIRSGTLLGCPGATGRR